MATRDNMTTCRFGRGTCPVCRRPIRLLKDGTIGPHSSKRMFPPTPCAGWREKPKEG